MVSLAYPSALFCMLTIKTELLNAELLNAYYERDMQERAACDSLFQEYCEWDAEEATPCRLELPNILG